MKTSLSATALLTLALGAASLALPSSASAETHVGVNIGIGVPVPHGYTSVHVGRDNYYYHRGVFYRPGPRGYYVVRAPRGAVIRTLPPHYSRVYIGSSVYYRYGDVYYRDYDGGYVVVDAPPTTVVTTSAPPSNAVIGAPVQDDTQTIVVGTEEYEFKDGQFFKKNADGLVWTPAPLGAITKSLPNDARSVWYQDTEYFEVEDVYFKKTQEGYRVVEAPWKAGKK